ncbi:MAG: EAL domain-containing protein [Arenimonas sp.]
MQVNDAWRKFSLGNLLQGPDYGIGVNYLWICDSARGDDSGDAHQVAAGIRSVLKDGVKYFSIEYPCHSSTEQRWFCLTVTPIIYGRQTGAVVMHTNITQQKIAARELLESERRFSDMLANVQLASVMLDLDAKITYCNEYLLQLAGWKQEEVIGRDWFETFMPRDRGDMKPVFEDLLQDKPDAKHREHEIVTRSGKSRLFRWNNSLLRSGAGEVIGTASIGEDITERRQASKKIEQLNRIHIVLSSINSLILKLRDRDGLYSEACRIAVEAGGFRMAVIGMVDIAAMKFVPVASAGADHGLFAAIEQELIARGNPENGTNMGSLAVTEKRAVVSNDPKNDPLVLLGKRYVDAGIRSIAVLPLIVADQAIGILALYAGESDFFHEDELKLLNTLAENISFAVDHIKKQERLDYLAYYDDVTGLANRRLFIERVALYLQNAQNAGHGLAVGLIDLERFKNINDSLGHATGDALLTQIAQWLLQNLGGANVVAHLGADHFAMVIPLIMKGGSVERLLNKQFEALSNHPFQLNGGVFKIAFKGGIAIFPEDGIEAEILFKNAEAALKKAKARGDRYLFYQPDMTNKVAGRLNMENQLRQALENNEFVLHYQPKISLETGKITGAEALIRWNDPRTGLVAPTQFISILEETGLIYEDGRWALRDALNTHFQWRKMGLATPRIAVNVSPLQLRHRDFVSRIKAAISFDSNAAESLELEITESLIMEDVKHSIASLKAIRDMGVTIAIDDFGTGFSSLSYLSKLPIDTLKIDRSFITEMTISPEGQSLVSTIIKLGQSLNLKMVAEGVETEEQRGLLKSLGCQEMQGFLFSKAVPSDQFEKRFLNMDSLDCTL